MSGDQIALVDKFSKTPSWLHLGGVPLDNVKDTLPVSGFIGCMKDLKVILVIVFLMLLLIFLLDFR